MQRPLAHLAGLGVYIPSRIVTNHDFAERLVACMCDRLGEMPALARPSKVVGVSEAAPTHAHEPRDLFGDAAEPGVRWDALEIRVDRFDRIDDGQLVH